VLTDTFEPGSTIKPFTVAIALEKGAVAPNTNMLIGAKYLVGPKPITDTHLYNNLTVAQIIQKSSNIGTAKIAMNNLSTEEMWNFYTSVGLGQAPKIGFPGAVAGTVHPYKKWMPTDQARIAFGYGISASLFQIARAYTIFARDGELVPLTIERSPVFKPGTHVISAKTAIEMRNMMESVTEPGGTAIKAQAEGYRVGGKTGTAHKLVGKGYGNKYRAYFAGLAPMSAPRIVVAVMIDEPTSGSHYGGDVAAPVFSTIVSETLRTLNVAPDININQGELKDKNPAIEVPAAKLQYPLFVKSPPRVIPTDVVPPAAVVYGKNLPPLFTVMLPNTFIALLVAFHCKIPLTSKETILVT
jgi:cell division protein FtsI (penicillin-binding protein 3)